MDIIQELGNATDNNFSSAAKLVLITGNGAQFAVIDGANFVDVSGIMSIQQPGDNRIRAGTKNGQTGLSFPTTKDLEIIELDYDDTGLPGGGLQFFLIGLANGSTTDTVPSNTGVYTETFKAKVSSMTGEGSSKDSGPFVATGSLSLSGKGDLSL